MKVGIGTRGVWLNAILGLILLILFILPLAALVQVSIDSDPSGPVATNPFALLWPTLTFGLGATAGSVLLGTLTAFALCTVSPSLRFPILGIAFMGVFVPSYIYVIAWIELLGPHGWLGFIPGLDLAALLSIPGAIVVQSFALHPIVACAGYVALTRLDVDKLDAARTEGTLSMAMRHVMLPHAAPFIATGALLVFLLSLTNYSVPSLMQVNTYSVEIFTMFNAFHNISAGVHQTLPVIAVAIAVILIWWWTVKSRISETSFTALQPRDLSFSNGPRVVGGGFLVILLLLSIGLPLAMVFARASFPEGVFAAWESTREEWSASLILALVSTGIILLLSGAMAYAVEKRPQSLELGISLLLAIPWLVTGPAWGIGLVTAWNHEGVRGWIYDHWTIAMIACVSKYLFVGWFGYRFALRTVHREYTDAAAVFGLGTARRFFAITLPLISPYLLVISIVVFLLTLGEVDTLLLVSPPGFITIPVRVYGLMHYGPSELVASLAVLMAGIVFGLGLFISLVALVWPRAGTRD